MIIQKLGDIINEAKTSGKRGDITTLVVNIGNKRFFNKEASNTFIEVIDFISKKVGIEKFITDINDYSVSGRKFIGLNESDFPVYVKNIKKNSTGQFLINTHMSTSEKKNILDSILEYFKIEGNVEVRNRVESPGKYLSDVDTDDSDVNQTEEIPDIEKMTFAKAAQVILQDNDNRSMTSFEIWNEISKRGLVETGGLTPKTSLNVRMLEYSDNSNVKKKSKTKLFTIVDFKEPYKFQLINPVEIQDVDEIEDSEYIEQKELPKEKIYDINPFRQAICILGKSGAGKSYTIDEILDSSNHEYEFIIPSASTTGLLSQFSPSAKEGRGGYIPSRLGKMIEKAYINSDKLYTAVFDECHKSNIIEMINDELLQAISTERNKNRFISLDDETSDLYPSKVLDKRGNIQITDNLGFIFISSNARVISGNEDFFNRVDLVELTKEGRESVKTIDDLNKLRVKDTDKKYELVSKIMSESKR